MTPKTLVQTVRFLTDDPQDLLEQVVQGDFPVAPNEASRLQAVQRSGLVDTPAEEQFDRVTWLAARGLKSPIALMTVLAQNPAVANAPHFRFYAGAPVYDPDSISNWLSTAGAIARTAP